MWIEIWPWIVKNVKLSDIISAATAVVLFFTLFAIIRQLRLNDKISRAQFGIEIMDKLRTEDWKNRLKEIYQAKDDELKKDGKLVPEAEFTLDKFEWVGIMLNENIFPPNIVMKLIEGLPIRVWYKLDRVGFVKMRRKKRGHYARYAEYFTKKSIEYQIKYKPMEEWTKLDTEDEEAISSKIIKKKELISSQELRRLNRIREIRAIFEKELNYGYPFECSDELEVALQSGDIDKIKEIFLINKKELRGAITILNPLKLYDTKLILNLRTNNWILERLKRISRLFNNKWISERRKKRILSLINNKWISKLRENKWKIIAGKREYTIVKSIDKMYDCKGYEMWYRDVVKSIKSIS